MTPVIALWLRPVINEWGGGKKSVPLWTLNSLIYQQVFLLIDFGLKVGAVPDRINCATPKKSINLKGI